jgi:hypothetical protein
MVVYSRYPIITDSVRPFQTFLWDDMPGALLPDVPDTAEPADWYTEAELEVVRLSSKSHWDVPIDVDGTTIHALVSHPTPPVFDGPEDRNGLLLASLVLLAVSSIPRATAAEPSIRFASFNASLNRSNAGDLITDLSTADNAQDAILQLLDSPFVNTSRTPSSLGGIEQAAGQLLNHRSFLRVVY